MTVLQGAGYPLLLSTVAGLSTSLGAVAAVLHKPSDATLALLLGSAIGVMGSVSIVELWLHNALQNSPLWVTLSVAAGAAVFCAIDPLLPKPPEEASESLLGPAADAEQGEAHRSGSAKGDAQAAGSRATTASAVRGGASSVQRTAVTVVAAAGPVEGAAQHVLVRVPNAAGQGGGSGGMSPSGSPCARQAAAHAPDKDAGSGQGLGRPSRRPASLMRLGILMAVTMTLHNLPEGFAVAFAALTDVGPAMAFAIAMHNIPEGIIVAAPIYAATGSKWRAVGVATASGLSEPLGALVALLLVKPFVTTVAQLDYLLAAVGGVMLAVCAVELWPEARRCRNDVGMAQGIFIGAVLMLWTLWVGV